MTVPVLSTEQPARLFPESAGCGLSSCRWFRIQPLILLVVASLVGLLGSGCASVPPQGASARIQAAALRDQLLLLDASVDRGEAARLADTAVDQSAAFARQYRAVRPAWFHNCLVNSGLRPRGLCFEWANDLFPRFYELRLRSLKLHLAVAKMDTSHEHNAIVVTALQQPFAEGVVIDAWRFSGNLSFGKVAADKYPWQPLPPDRVDPELQKLMVE